MGDERGGGWIVRCCDEEAVTTPSSVIQSVSDHTQAAHERTQSGAEMRLVVLLFLATVFHSLLLSGALDDDEGEDSQQYAVTFFQFQPKDIPMLGGHRKNPFKRDIKRSTVEGPL